MCGSQVSDPSGITAEPWKFRKMPFNSEDEISTTAYGWMIILLHTYNSSIVHAIIWILTSENFPHHNTKRVDIDLCYHKIGVFENTKQKNMSDLSIF